jgi:hypothetical protein
MMMHKLYAPLIKQSTRDNAKSVTEGRVLFLKLRAVRKQSHRIGPKTGFDANTTTAFWTVERVTSSPLTRRDDDAICRLHLSEGNQDRQGEHVQTTYDIPNAVVALGREGTT